MKWTPGLMGIMIALLTPGAGFAEDSVAGASAVATNALPAYLEDAGPDQLKTQTRVTVITNALPPTAAAVQASPPPRRTDWQASWKGWDGLHFDLTRKTLLGSTVTGVTNLRAVHLEETRMAGKIGAKFALDAAAFVTDDAFTGFDAGAELRRARIYVKGDCLVLFPVSYEFELGYIPGSFYLENTYLEFHELGFLDFLGSLKLGQYQVPMSLENCGSSRDMMFMETASPLAALAPGVNAGVQVGQPVLNERLTWALGLFTDGVGYDFGDATEDVGRVVGRLTALPIYQRDPEHPESQRLLHLGLSGSAIYTDASAVRYGSRPESHLAPSVVDTGDIAAKGAQTGGLEIAWVNGPLCVQGEYLLSMVQNITNRIDYNFDGFYASASWFLTGESRPYDRSQGTFGRVIPKRNFNFSKSGWGAWEVAGRYSFVDLNSADIAGGRMSMIMAGVNWYLHSHVKWRFNYGFGQVTGRDPSGNLKLFQTRLEMDF